MENLSFLKKGVDKTGKEFYDKYTQGMLSMFIDIHNHTLFGVDDGAVNLGEALAMLKDARQQGAEAIVLTPHYRRGMFAYPVEQIEERFQQLSPMAAGMGLQLYLGCECHVNSDIVENLQSGRCKTLAESDYVLTEYSYQTDYAYMAEYTSRLFSYGYIPVIAHVERYKCLRDRPALCAELQGKGALVQVNADSVLGIDGRGVEHFCRKLLKHEWADVVASDAHGRKERANHMEKCRKAVEKKYGTIYAERLFVGNPERILRNG